MNYLAQILFFFGAIGVFNSFIVAGYFLFSKSYQDLSNRIFGLFLLVLSLRVLKSLFYAFSTETSIWFLQSGPSFFLLIGPLLFTYILGKIKPDSIWLNYWKHHLSFWMLTMICLTVFIPFSENVALNKKVILPIINLQWLAYSIIGLILIYITIPDWKRTSLIEKWLIALGTANLILWACYFFIRFQYFVSGSICFSFLFYAFFLFFLLKRKARGIVFKETKKKKNVAPSRELKKALYELMTDKKLYTNPNLKLTEVAQNLDISPHYLSQFINESIGKSFTDFLNEYRIEEAKQLILRDSIYTMEAIGNLSGFNSKSAFYKAFKKHTKTTPAKFKLKN